MSEKLIKYVVSLPTEDNTLVDIIEIIISNGLDGKGEDPTKHFLLLQERLGSIAGIVYRLDSDPTKVGELVAEIIELSSDCIRWIEILYSLKE